ARPEGSGEAARHPGGHGQVAAVRGAEGTAGEAAMDERANQAMAEIDRAIAEALDVPPSPEFVARVRQRIADEPKPAGSWLTGRRAVGVASAAAAGPAAALGRRSNGRTQNPAALAARSLDRFGGVLAEPREVRLQSLDRRPYVVSAFRRPPSKDGRTPAS